MLPNTDLHFQNTCVINFDIIHRLPRGENIPNEIYKNLQTICEDEIKKYPINNQKEILGSIFRSERKDILFNKKNLEIYFKDQHKQVVLSSMAKRKLKKKLDGDMK